MLKVTERVGGKAGTQIQLFRVPGCSPTSRWSWELGGGVFWQVGCLVLQE